MEQKVRFKMHKVKKNWVTIGVTALSMVTVAGGTLLADQQVQADEQNPANQSSDSSQDLLQETPATTNDVATTVAPTISADANTASVAIPVADATSTTTNATDRAAASASNVATVQTNSGQAAPSTNVQPAATDTSATATDTNTNTNTNASVTATDRVATTDRAATTDTASTEARTRSRRALAETREANTNTATGIQWINGKQYYVNSDGSVRKNFVFEQDGKSYYFDAETGALATKSQDEFSTEPIKATVDFSSGNQLYKNDDKSLDQLDTFITADAWYRPKSILKDGKTWTASTEADKRPLLMVWWPDKSTQVNYLNYMQNQGLGAGSFSTNSSQESLDQAAKMVQTKIEERIAREGNTNWLRTSIDQFIKTQPGWNSSTENSSYDHLQGGQLLFNNSKGDTGNRTSHANSDYRLLNRTPTNQTGTRKYFKDNSIGGLEFLLANDIDNSNPAVQAEQLNWLHFMMNIGSIMANDPTANFDGLRVDALDNVDADLLQIASDYFKAAYGVDKSEANAIKHLSYLEAWSANDPYYNKDTKGAQLPIDNALRNALTNLLMRDKNTRMQLGDMTAFINSSLNPRGANDKNGERMANYIFTRAHDTEAQTIIQRIIRDRINPNLFGYNFTRDEIKKAFEIYNEDIDKAHKTYASYNLPSVYALMLTNKDSVTRVYYGDLYREDGHYMAKKTPYFDAIDTLLRARIKYVAGGQDMEVKKVGNDGLLTSVRYGKGANNRTDLGTSETRTQGMGVIMTNNYDFRLGSNETVTMNMGRAHRNQLYRPLLLTTKDGIA
ncbi:MAG: glycoside hydrolase family 70 protein, partial [Streptococcus salivarius]|nr:glycoside hydrolase family 70 protein [Streptococcus salivarius]